MAKVEFSRNAWIKGGAAASLAVLALAMLRGSRLGGKLAAGFAGAFLEAWGDLRLERKVAGILAKAEARADDEGGREELRKLWNP